MAKTKKTTPREPYVPRVYTPEEEAQSIEGGVKLQLDFLKDRRERLFARMLEAVAEAKNGRPLDGNFLFLAGDLLQADTQCRAYEQTLQMAEDMHRQVRRLAKPDLTPDPES